MQKKIYKDIARTWGTKLHGEVGQVSSLFFGVYKVILQRCIKSWWAWIGSIRTDIFAWWWNQELEGTGEKGIMETWGKTFSHVWIKLPLEVVEAGTQGTIKIRLDSTKIGKVQRVEGQTWANGDAFRSAEKSWGKSMFRCSYNYYNFDSIIWIWIFLTWCCWYSKF